jgi:hypothetical protein
MLGLISFSSHAMDITFPSREVIKERLEGNGLMDLEFQTKFSEKFGAMKGSLFSVVDKVKWFLWEYVMKIPNLMVCQQLPNIQKTALRLLLQDHPKALKVLTEKGPL